MGSLFGSFERKSDSREREIEKLFEGMTLDLLKSDGAKHGAATENIQLSLYFTCPC
jgi:hypothetical protein